MGAYLAHDPNLDLRVFATSARMNALWRNIPIIQVLFQSLCRKGECVWHDRGAGVVLYAQKPKLLHKLFFLVLCVFIKFLGSPGESFLVHLLQQIEFFMKRWDPRFCKPL